MSRKPKALVTNETFLTETTSLRHEIANMKVELIKWNIGTITAVAGVVAAIVKLI